MDEQLRTLIRDVTTKASRVIRRWDADSVDDDLMQTDIRRLDTALGVLHEAMSDG